MGFEQVGHECVGHVEWDKYAQASYAAIYGQGREEEYANEFNGWDITTIAGADLPRADLWNFGAPCQDFSMAGKRAGLGGERSSLVQEVFRLYRETAEENRPTYLIYENVKGMLSSNGGRDFLAIITEMESLGFVVEWGMLNSKYWGVPQNRERVFTVGTRADKWSGPIMQDLLLAQEVNGVQTKLRDVLEDGVDEKYYLAPEKTERLVMQLDNRNKADDQIKILGHRKGYRRNTQVFDESGLTETLDTGMGGGRGHYTMEPKVISIGNVNPSGNGMNGNVFADNGLAPTLTTNKGEGNKILEGLPIKEATKQGYDIANEGDSVNLQYPDSTTRRGRVGKGLANTLQATSDSNQGVVENYRIRKLTPKECWRLQGFPDWAFDLASGACSDSQIQTSWKLGERSGNKSNSGDIGGKRMITELTARIEEWAKERNLHTADPAKQMLKLGEEFGELCQGMAKNKPDQIEDSIGDMYVVLTILSMQLGLDIGHCISGAYAEIKNRKGKMVDGVFIKEADLKEV